MRTMSYMLQIVPSHGPLYGVNTEVYGLVQVCNSATWRVTVGPAAAVVTHQAVVCSQLCSPTSTQPSHIRHACP